MQTCLKCGFAFWNMYLIKHNAIGWGEGGDPGDVLDLFCWLEVIHCWVCFVLAGAASLKIKLAKQINHMMRRLADCCCSPPPSSFLLAFFPSFPPEVAAFSPQGSLWTRPDVPGSTLPHSLPHGIFMGNQAPQHSTVPHRPEPPYLLISSPCCLAVWCTTVEHRGSSPLSVFSLRHSLHFCFFF